MLGYKVGAGASTVSSSIAIGTCALYNHTGNSIIAIGIKAHSSSTGYGWGTVAIGMCAGLCNTTGQLNTYVGKDAGKLATGGTYNAYFGQSAGLCATGNSNTMIGACAGRCFRSGGGNVFVGKYTSLFLLSCSYHCQDVLCFTT